MTVSRLPHLYGVILAGGSGTRLWPLSTKERPKQFLSIGSEESLISQTASRLHPLVDQENIWVVCGRSHGKALSDHVSTISKDQILMEPEAKNTAPALALAAIHLKVRDPEAMMAVLPADHLILKHDWDSFREDLFLAAEVAKSEKALVTFGIPPDHPATGFGYLEEGEKYRQGERDYFQVRAFHEKPDKETAQRYLNQGGYYWNSGMFLWEVETFFNELKRSQPEIYELFLGLEKEIPSPQYQNRLEEVFSKVNNISVDYAVMENAEKVMMVPASFPWDDVGSLTAFTKVLEGDKDGNFTQGRVYFVEAGGNLVISQTKPIAVVGVNDVVVVDSPKGILVLPKEKAQDVKKIVELLKENGHDDLL